MNAPPTLTPPTRPAPPRLLVKPLEWLLILVILFEEWGWEPLQRFMVALARYPVIGQLELRAALLPPRLALLVFALPSVLLLPVNLLALWLTAAGQAALGSTLLIAAKLVGTTLVARIFTLTRPALMQLPWFARLYHRWIAFEAALMAPVRNSRLWRAAKETKRRVKAWWRVKIKPWWKDVRAVLLP